MHAFYLHGFASSARSKKAAYFADRFRAAGIALRCPDFNEPDFTSMTMTRMLAQLESEMTKLGPGPVVLVGSSLGAVVALYTAVRAAARVDRLVLLAPGVMFGREDPPFLSAEDVQAWRRTGMLEIFHWADGSHKPLSYAFYEDSLHYDVTSVQVSQPMLIMQGRQDPIVDWRSVERFASARPNATLTLLDDDHQMLSSLPRIWNEMAAFVGLPASTEF